MAGNRYNDEDEGNLGLRALLRKKINTNRGNNTCNKVSLPEYLAAFVEERELDRDIKAIDCRQDLIEKVMGNYVVVKTILKFLTWQEKMMCKEVCPLWNTAVKNLQHEQLRPVDFSVNLGRSTSRYGVRLLKSTELYTEPMVMFTFCNTVALNVYTVGCGTFTPSPCSPPCGQDHSILDIMFQALSAPKESMFAIKAYSLSYFPLSQSITIRNAIGVPLRGSNAFFCGLSIPKIPGVEFKMINISDADGIQQVLLPEIKKLTESYIVKGVIACLTDNYLLYADEVNAESLEFLHDMQPNIPFAFGGCLVEDTANKQQDIERIVESVNIEKEFISGNIMSLGLFLIPKVDNNKPGSSSTNLEELNHNFEVYSFVIDSSEWSKTKIQDAIQEFSERVPRYQNSIVIKFSCMGRQHKHETEQYCFRQYFPYTRLIGCFGNGELGVCHPERRQAGPSAAKRPRENPQYQKVRSYTTVFFYICWGRVTEEAEHAD